MGNMAKSPFLWLLLSFSWFSPKISKTVRGTGLKFFTQVGSDAVTCCKQCSLCVNNSNAFHNTLLENKN